jgi:hypothetical protein
LPALAWLLQLEGRQATLVCGEGVEVFDDGFFEGCWAGDFARQRFAAARHVFGSGGIRSPGDAAGWTIVTPSHMLDAVYLLERHERLEAASNSLAFLTCWADIELAFDPGIAGWMISVREGVDRYERLLFEGTGGRIRRACFDNVEVAPGMLRHVAKPPVTERFTGFDAYETYLLSAVPKTIMA